MNASVIKLAPTQVATLSSSALLVSLNISCGTFKKKDRGTSDEVLASKGARTRCASVEKILLADSKELEAISKFAAMVRTWNNGQTLPWHDKGPRLLPAARMLDYKTQVGEFEREFNKLLDAFIDSYHLAVQAAQFGMVGMFDINDYPDVSEVRTKFSFDVYFSPLPEAGDFRVTIGQQGLDELRQTYEAQANRALEMAMSENWKRLHAAVSTISRQLNIDASGTKGKLYEGSLEGVLELCDMLEDFNLTGDLEMEKARRELKMTLQGVNLKELKKDDGARLAIKAEVDEILSKFNI